MTDQGQSPASRPHTISGWQVPTQPECESLKHPVHEYSETTRVCGSLGYIEGDLVLFDYRLEILIDGSWICSVRVYCEQNVVLHCLYNQEGIVTSCDQIASLECQQDVVRAHSDAFNLIEPNLGMEGDADE